MGKKSSMIESRNILNPTSVRTSTQNTFPKSYGSRLLFHYKEINTGKLTKLLKVRCSPIALSN